MPTVSLINYVSILLIMVVVIDQWIFLMAFSDLNCIRYACSLRFCRFRREESVPGYL